RPARMRRPPDPRGWRPRPHPHRHAHVHAADGAECPVRRSRPGERLESVPEVTERRGESVPFWEGEFSGWQRRATLSPTVAVLRTASLSGAVGERGWGSGRSGNAKCKLQSAKGKVAFCILPFALCSLHCLYPEPLPSPPLPQSRRKSDHTATAGE